MRVAAGERCVILDHLTEEGRKTRNEMWLPVEKLGSSAPKLGRIKHEYEVEGDAVTVDRFIYLSGDTACEDAVLFAGFPDGQK